MSFEDDLDKCKRLLLEVEEFAYKAEANQWKTAPKLIEERVGSPAPGRISDPTGELATDPNRLALRQALQETERNARLLREALERMHYRLKKATDPYAESPN